MSSSLGGTGPCPGRAVVLFLRPERWAASVTPPPSTSRRPLYPGCGSPAPSIRIGPRTASRPLPEPCLSAQRWRPGRAPPGRPVAAAQPPASLTASSSTPTQGAGHGLCEDTPSLTPGPGPLVQAPAPPGRLGGGPRACCGPTGDPGSPRTGRRGLCFEATFVSLKVDSGSSCQSRALAESAQLLGCCSQNHWRGGSACANDCGVVAALLEAALGSGARTPNPALACSPPSLGTRVPRGQSGAGALPPCPPTPAPRLPGPCRPSPFLTVPQHGPCFLAIVRTPGPRLVPVGFRDPLCHCLYNSLGDTGFGGTKK